jgi:hypothetical protein
LALGAASGKSISSSTCKAQGWFGIRMATSDEPAVTTSEINSFLGSKMVSGPGENVSNSFF